MVRYRHRKRGTTYVIIGRARAQCEEPILDDENVLVYRCLETGDLAVRPPGEFFDGRFEKIED